MDWGVITVMVVAGIALIGLGVIILLLLYTIYE